VLKRFLSKLINWRNMYGPTKEMALLRLQMGEEKQAAPASLTLAWWSSRFRRGFLSQKAVVASLALISPY